MFASRSPRCRASSSSARARSRFGKLSQALDYGALTLQIQGDFDDCLRRIRQIAVDVPAMGIYLMNSVNPFRLEGQKTIMYRILEARDWEPPDWIIVPGGNLGNCSAFGKAFMELKELGLIKKIPRLAVINASGANTLNVLFNRARHDVERRQLGRSRSRRTTTPRWTNRNYSPHTVASAIEISRPVNLPKALRALDVMNGVVREVSDEEILEHRAMVARWGFGCEPASAASVAGLHKLLDEQVISPDESVVCILTGHELKDPNATVKYHTGIDMKAVQDLAPRVRAEGQAGQPPGPGRGRPRSDRPRDGRQPGDAQGRQQDAAQEQRADPRVLIANGATMADSATRRADRF